MRESYRGCLVSVCHSSCYKVRLHITITGFSCSVQKHRWLYSVPLRPFPALCCVSGIVFWCSQQAWVFMRLKYIQQLRGGCVTLDSLFHNDHILFGYPNTREICPILALRGKCVARTERNAYRLNGNGMNAERNRSKR